MSSPSLNSVVSKASSVPLRKVFTLRFTAACFIARARPFTFTVTSKALSVISSLYAGVPKVSIHSPRTSSSDSERNLSVSLPFFSFSYEEFTCEIVVPNLSAKAFTLAWCKACAFASIGLMFNGAGNVNSASTVTTFCAKLTSIHRVKRSSMLIRSNILLFFEACNASPTSKIQNPHHKAFTL